MANRDVIYVIARADNGVIARDGKGQWRIASAHEAGGLRVPNAGLVYEGLVRFEAEFSVILVRGRNGEVRFWDSPANVHEGGILARSSLPAPSIVTEQVPEARKLAAAVAEALGYVGVLTLEFFATAEGPVFNEMAPRVHNSGHWTLEGAITSQFENHIRAICALPLGDTATLTTRVEMTNLIGTGGAEAIGALADPAAHLHFYGKAEAREGRKMGHVTKVG
jgi:5-(carboxyamino)imidazole ribonucleotide synthase